MQKNHHFLALILSLLKYCLPDVVDTAKFIEWGILCKNIEINILKIEVRVTLNISRYTLLFLCRPSTNSAGV